MIEFALSSAILERGTCGILLNVHVDGSPWESDVVEVQSDGFWVEYEVKTSLSDFFHDFEKKIEHDRRTIRKHDYLTSGEQAGIPRPFSYNFVVPRQWSSAGAIERIPKMYGIITFFWTSDGRCHLELVRIARALANPTKIQDRGVVPMTGVRANMLTCGEIGEPAPLRRGNRPAHQRMPQVGKRHF